MKAIVGVGLACRVVARVRANSVAVIFPKEKTIRKADSFYSGTFGLQLGLLPERLSFSNLEKKTPAQMSGGHISNHRESNRN